MDSENDRPEPNMEELITLKKGSQEYGIPLRTLQYAAKAGNLERAILETNDNGSVWKAPRKSYLRFKGTHTPHDKSITNL